MVSDDRGRDGDDEQPHEVTRNRIEHGRDDARAATMIPSVTAAQRSSATPRSAGHRVSRDRAPWTRAGSPIGRTSAGRAPTLEAIPPEIGIDMRASCAADVRV